MIWILGYLLVWVCAAVFFMRLDQLNDIRDGVAANEVEPCWAIFWLMIIWPVGIPAGIIVLADTIFSPLFAIGKTLQPVARLATAIITPASVRKAKRAHK